MIHECEVHFLDVGQGSSSVVLFQNPLENHCEAILIDGGPKTGDIATLVLEDFADYLQAVFVTHNHLDHVGGIEKILRTWCKLGKFGDIYLLNDGTEGARLMAMTLKNEVKAGRLKRDQHHWLNEGAQYKYQTAGAAIEVLVRSPTLDEAILMKNANEASGVIQVRYRGTDVLFCGDSTRAIWTRIVNEAGIGPLGCEAVTVPHHGGHMDASRSPDNGPWFFSEAVKAKVAIFSFGASNNNRHPRPEVVCAAKTQGKCETILCTQIHPGLNLPPYPGGDNGLYEPTRYSLSKQDPSFQDGTARRRNYACAGSITLRLGPGGPVWGNGGDPDSICAFESIPEFQDKVGAVMKQAGWELPPCHGGTCPKSLSPGA
jgi:beta-lactamase superfamily II metal-dependent hydrolase